MERMREKKKASSANPTTARIRRLPTCYFVNNVLRSGLEHISFDFFRNLTCSFSYLPLAVTSLNEHDVAADNETVNHHHKVGFQDKLALCSQ